MRTVLCLGGTGQFGLPIARNLAADPVVDRDRAKAGRPMHGAPPRRRGPS